MNSRSEHTVGTSVALINCESCDFGSVTGFARSFKPYDGSNPAPKFRMIVHQRIPKVLSIKPVAWMGAAVFFMSTPKKGDLLVEATRYGNMKLVKRLTRTKGTPTNHPQRKTGLLALVEAGKTGNMEAAKELLIHGANINAADKRGTTPLMAALQKNRNGFMEMCLQLGVDFTLKDDTGRTALSLAVQANRLALVKRLLEKYPSFAETVNSPDMQGRTPIIYAALKGSLEMAGLLIDYNADVIHVDNYGKDAADYAGAAGYVDLAKMLSLGKKGLMIIRTDYFIDAVERGDMAQVEEFLKKEIEINRLHSSHGVGAVHRAAETNNIEMMDRLLAEGCNMELESRYRETPVVVAALHECTEMVLYLMGKKANMHTKSFDGLTPFQISAKYGYPEMMKALFDEGGVHSMPEAEMLEVLNSCHARSLPLFKAVRAAILRKRGDDVVNSSEKGNTSRVDRLVSIYGADVNHAHSGYPVAPAGKLPTYHGRTAIIAAAEYGHAETCVKLLHLGAEVTLVDMFGENALMKASYYGHVDCIVNLLMDGGNIHYENEFNGKTALHYAAEGNKPQAVIRLLEFGANPNCQTHGALLTPLMAACLLGSTESTRALVEHGADINAFDANRTNALMHAAGNGNDECVRALIEYGADITPENYFGKTALLIAMYKQRVGCIRLLLAATNRARDKLGDAMIEAVYNKDRITVRNALHLGAYFDHKHTVTGVDVMDAAHKVGFIVNIELLRGAKTAQQDRTLAESLADGARRGNVNQIRRIVELNKFNPETRVPSTGSWVLCTAAEYGQLEVTRYLVEEAKVDLEAKTLYDGRTPLICAAIAGHAHIVQYLVSMGAKPANIDMAGLSAVDYAEANNHTEVKVILRLSLQSKVLASRVRRNIRLRKLRKDRVATFIAKMAEKGVTITEEEAERLMKPSKRADGQKHHGAGHEHGHHEGHEELTNGGKMDRHFGHAHGGIGGGDKAGSSFAQALSVFNKAGKSGGGSALAGLLNKSKPSAVATTTSTTDKTASDGSTKSAEAPAKPIAGLSLLSNVGEKFIPGKPILAYESGDDDNSDLVEQIDYDFSVRSPWMTAVMEAHATQATSDSTAAAPSPAKA